MNNPNDTSVHVTDFFTNLRDFLKSPKNIMMSASVFFLLAYQITLIVNVYNIAPNNAAAYKAVILPTLFLAVLPTIYTRKMGGDILPAFVVGFLTLTGVAFQAAISKSFSGYGAIAYLSVFTVLAVAALIKLWDKLKCERKLVTTFYWIATGVLAVSGFVMRLLLRPINGAYCWLKIGGTSLQLTEVLKLIFVVAIMLCVRNARSDREIFYKTFITTGSMCFSMLCVNEGGTLLVCLLTWLIFLFFVIDDTKTLIKSYGIVLAIAIIGVIALAVIHKYLSAQSGFLGTLYDFTDKVFNRLSALLPQFSENSDIYQIDKAISAIRLGRLFGSNSSYLNSLPEGDSDFILASVCSRFGVAVTSIVVVGFLYFFLHTVRLYHRNDNGVLSLIASTILFVQAILVVLSNLAIIPVIGITLPLISNGGSSFCVCIAFFTAALISTGKNDNIILREEE